MTRNIVYLILLRRLYYIFRAKTKTFSEARISFPKRRSKRTVVVSHLRKNNLFLLLFAFDCDIIYIIRQLPYDAKEVRSVKVAVCDDLEQERKTLCDCLRRYEKEENLELDIFEYDGAETLISDFRKGNAPDVLFLDIYMNGLSGTDALKTLLNEGFSGSTVLCTTSRDHALDGYRLKAEGYLVKPYDYGDFLAAIWHCKRRFDESKKSVTFISERLSHTVPLKEIMFMETDGKGSSVHTGTGSFFTWKKLCEFEEELKEEPSFIRVGRYYIVNLNSVANTTDDKLIFTDGKSINLPVRDKNRIRTEVNDWFWKKLREEK